MENEKLFPSNLLLIPSSLTGTGGKGHHTTSPSSPSTFGRERRVWIDGNLFPTRILSGWRKYRRTSTAAVGKYF